MEKEIKWPVLPGYPVYEYMLVLLPHEELRAKIHAVKQAFSEKYKVDAGKAGMAQVPLVIFKQYGMREEHIVNHLKTISMSVKPMKIELKDYGSYPSHSIFINITSKLPVQALVKLVRSETQRLMKLNNENKPLFMSDPVITIARKLQPWQYERGWQEMSHRQFTGRFIADAMLLMKRKPGQFKYEVVQRFAFESLPVFTTQGNLFE